MGLQSFLNTFYGTLAAGAWPRLTRLALSMKPEDAPLLAAALEAQQDLGCAGLAQLSTKPFDWLSTGPIETRRWMWVVLFPTLEEPPYGRLERTGGHEATIADAVVEHCVPRLRALGIDKFVMVRCLARLPALESLSMYSTAAAGKAYSGLFAEAVAAAGGSRRFLPALRRLRASAHSPGAVERLLRPLGAGFFSRVKELKLEFAPRPTYSEIQFSIKPKPKRFPRHAGVELGHALAAGAFASLEALELGLRMDAETAGALVDLAAWVLFDAPSARTLRSLTVLARIDRRWGAAAGSCRRWARRSRSAGYRRWSM